MLCIDLNCKASFAAPHKLAGIGADRGCVFSGKWFFRHRGVIAHAPLLLVLFWRRGEVSNPAMTWIPGLALLFAGMTLRIWAQSYIHHRLKLPLELTTGGPYQLVRNPLYIGNAAVCASADACCVAWEARRSLGLHQPPTCQNKGYQRVITPLT